MTVKELLETEAADLLTEMEEFTAGLGDNFYGGDCHETNVKFLEGRATEIFEGPLLTEIKKQYDERKELHDSNPKGKN